MSKGTRLPEGWQPDPTDTLKLSREFPGFNLAAELDNFRDYWTAKAGAAATKMDWNATYRIWMRKAGKAPRARGEAPARAPTPPVTAAQPDHLVYFANRLLFEHLADCHGVGPDTLARALAVKRETIEWFLGPVSEGDPNATPHEFVVQFGKALAKVSPLQHRTRKRWRQFLASEASQRPFPPYMARPLQR